MLKINIQLFAHKKGVGSTKNGRDSESKRLGVKRADGQFVLAGTILVRHICVFFGFGNPPKRVLFFPLKKTINLTAARLHAPRFCIAA